MDSLFFESGEINGLPVLDIGKLNEENFSRAVNVVVGLADMRRGLALREEYPFIEKVFYPDGISRNPEKRISKEFCKEHIEMLQTVFECLEDERSKDIFISWLNGNMTADVQEILPYVEKSGGYFANDVWDTEGDETFVDVGAYTGDTIEQYLHINPRCKKIYAFEGASELADALRAHYGGLVADGILEIYETVLWHSRIMVQFLKAQAWGSGGSNVIAEKDGGNGQYTDTLDSLLSNSLEIDLIKINVVGAINVLRGARTIVLRDHPRIAIKVWYNLDQIIDIVRYLKKECGYRVFVRLMNYTLEEILILAA